MKTFRDEIIERVKTYEGKYYKMLQESNKWVDTLTKAVQLQKLDSVSKLGKIFSMRNELMKLQGRSRYRVSTYTKSLNSDKIKQLNFLIKAL